MKKTWAYNHYYLMAVAGLLVASVAWTFVMVQSISVPLPEKRASLAVSLDYQVVSQKDLLLWPDGTIFGPGSAAYFYAADPKLSVTPTVEVSGLTGGQFVGSFTARARLQAVNDKGVAYWSYPLVELPEQKFAWQGATQGQENAKDQGDEQLLVKGEALEVEIEKAKGLVAQIGDELDFQSAVYQVVVGVNIQMAGVVNGEVIERTFEQTLPVTLLPSSFTLPAPADIALEAPLNSSLFQGATTSEVGKGFPGALGLVVEFPVQFALDALLLGMLITLLLRQRQGRSKQVQEHKRFKDWITEGRVETANKLQIGILTLEGLVDLAIDLDKRVIHDASSDKYFVLTDDLIYVFDVAKADAILENKPQLGKLLLDKGLLRPDQLETALYYQQKLGSRLGESLMALGFIDEVTLYSALASQQGVDYLELDLETVLDDISWTEGLDVQKARALQVLPLGLRSDGKWAVASSEPAKSGIQQALREALGAEVFMAATRPSRIYEALESIAALIVNMQGGQSEGEIQEDSESYKRLTLDEQRQFKEAYVRGSVLQSLLLKAGGLSFANALTSKQSETAALLKGIDKAVAAMDWQSRQSLRQPELLAILHAANYMTAETVDWIHRESAIQQVAIEHLLKQNHLAAKSTLKTATGLLDVLENLLSKAMS